MDKRPEVVDNFATEPEPTRAPGTTPPRLAQPADSTRLGMLGPRSPTRSGAEQSRSDQEGRLPERVLLRGYGLNPDDLELERIKR